MRGQEDEAVRSALRGPRGRLKGPGMSWKVVLHSRVFAAAEKCGTHAMRRRVVQAKEFSEGVMTTMRSEGHATVGRAYSGTGCIAAAPRRGFLLAAPLCLSFATVLAGAAAAQEVMFSSGTYRVSEGDALTPELVLSHARSEDVTVRVEALDLGEAKSGEDFATDPWHVTVPAGRTRRSFSIATFRDAKVERNEQFLLHVAPWGHSPGLRRSSNGNADAVAYIADPDTLVSLPESTDIVLEGGTATIRVTIPNPRPTAFTLDYTLSGGTASAADVVGGFGIRSVNVPANAGGVDISIRTAQDNVRSEGVETFSVRLSTSEPGIVFGRGTVDVSIHDDDTKPTVTFESVWSSADEGAGTHHVPVKLSPAPASDLEVRYSVRDYDIPAERTTPGADYEALSGSVTVPRGATTATIPIAVVDDDEQEGREHIVLRLSWNEHYERTGSRLANHVVTIVDNEPYTIASFAGGHPGISFSQLADEGSGTVDLTVNLSPAPASGITLRYAVSGSAEPGSDYAALSGTVAVPKGATTATIPVTLVDDAVYEGTEDIVLVLARGKGWSFDPWRQYYALSVADNEPVMSFAEYFLVSNVWEGAGTRNVKVRLSPAPAADTTITYSVGGTATPGSDYAALPGTVTVPKGARTAVIPVTIIDDNVGEYSETVVLELVSSGGYRVSGPGSPGRHTLYIADDDPTATFAVASGTVREGKRTTVEVRLDKPTSSDRTIAYTVGGTATPGADFTLYDDESHIHGSGTITLAKGWTRRTIFMTTVDDSLQEGDETVVLTLAAGEGYAVGSLGTHVLTIAEDDAPRVSFASASGTVGEGSGTHDVEVRLSPAPAAETTITYSVGGTATAGSDYTIAGSGTLTVPKGATTAAIPVTIIDDSVEDGGETVVLTLTAGNGYAVGATGTHTLTIRNHEPAAPSVTVARKAGTASSIAEGGDAAFTLTADPAPAADLPVTVTVATDGDWGVTAGSRTVTIPTTGSAVLTLATTDDAADEPDGSVTVTVDDGSGYTAGDPASGTVAVRDDDTPLPVVTVSAGSAVTEGGDAAFTLTASPAPAADLAVSVTVATDGDWGVTTGPQTVTIPTTGSAVLTLATTGDAVDEPDGSVSVTVADGSGYTVGSSASGTVSVRDDDDAAPAVAAVDPALVAEVRAMAEQTHHGQAHVKRWRRVLVAFGVEEYPGLTPTTAAEAKANAQKYSSPLWPKIADALEKLEAAAQQDQDQQQEPEIAVSAGSAVTEGGDAVFTLTATPAPAADLAVSVTVAADGDWGVTAGSRTVTIPTTGSATLTLATTDDAADEPDGSVTVTVADGSGYTVGASASGTVAVRDDDAPLPEVTLAAGAAVTEGGNAVFTLTATPAPAADLAVSVSVAADGDWGVTAGTQTVTIPTTGSATLTLATTDDAADEPDGSVTATVVDGSGYTVGASASGTVAVRDDDLPPPAVTIAAKASSVTEGGDAEFTLSADRAPDADLTVTLAVSETGAGDHVAAPDEGPATVTIPKGATEATFTLATVNDDADEPDGSVSVTVTACAGCTVGAPASASVEVTDDDAPSTAPALSVGDSTAKEGARLPVMPFTVRLTPPAPAPVRVYVSTRPSTPVSAEPGRDYAPGSSDLTFAAGETEKQVWIRIYDDSHDEGAETFEVVLSQAEGATIGDGVAVGTIVNDDPMPAAWLGRFGRTVAEQALDGIAGRMSAPRAPGMQGALAGQALNFDPAASGTPAAGGVPGSGSGTSAGTAPANGEAALAMADIARGFGSHSDHDPAGFGNGPGFMSSGSMSGTGGTGFGQTSAQSRTMTARDALLGSSFSLTGEKDGTGGSMAFWGRAAQGSFDGREGTFSLDGTVTTGMLGADYARGRWLIGLALARSDGEGDYRDTDIAPRPGDQTCPAEAAELCRDAVREGDGAVEASLTAAVPYAALQASERLKLWGAAGYGSGRVTLKTAMNQRLSADTSWSMAAAGLRGGLLEPPAEGSGPALAVTSDALWTRTSSEKTDQLAASDSDVTRLRVGLEGSYHVALEDGGSLAPKLELGARHDGGDAETGFGVEVGGGVEWTAPGMGLILDVSGRTLLAHGDDDLKDRGFSAALAWDPAPATGRGASLSLRQDFGGRATGGLDALFQPVALDDRTGGGEATSRWALEAAYGLPVLGGRWTGSPHAGFGLATGARDYSVGWRLAPEAANAPDFTFGLQATRRESDTQAVEHTVGVELTARW